MATHLMQLPSYPARTSQASYSTTGGLSLLVACSLGTAAAAEPWGARGTLGRVKPVAMEPLERKIQIAPSAWFRAGFPISVQAI